MQEAPWWIAFSITLAGLSIGAAGLAYRYALLKKRFFATKETLQSALQREQELTQQLENLQAKFKQEVLCDPLTGLPALSIFKEKIQEVLKQSERNKALFGLLFIDLRHFKTINNTLGYPFGDELLKEVAARMELALRRIDSLCRFSGDIFVVLLSQLAHPESAELIARRLFQKFDEPFKLHGHELFVSLSIGIALYPVDGRELEALFRNAAQALSEAKQKGVQSCAYYHASMRHHSERELALNGALCHDLVFKELTLEYQSQWDVEHKTLVGWEVLLRWQHPEFGLIAPREFIRLAEENGRIEIIGEWILQRVCDHLKGFQAQGLSAPTVAINISLRQLENPHFISTLLRILQETQASPKALVFEIAEADILKHSVLLEKSFKILKRLGVRMTIDHFEGGDLLLRYLKEFPLDYLKIDSSLIRDLESSKESEALVKAMVGLAKTLNKKIMALGVETEAQKQLLQQLGCAWMQGYYFSTPLSEREWLRSVQTLNREAVQEENLTVS